MKLKYIKEYRDITGKVRRYFRKKGQPDVRLPGEPGSAEFMKAYTEVLEGTFGPVCPKPLGASRIRKNVGCIYFLDDGNFIKIGFSTDLARRMNAYRTHRAFGLNLVAIIPDARPDDDQQLRRRFASLKARGDWFRKGPTLMAYVEQIKKEGPGSTVI